MPSLITITNPFTPQINPQIETIKSGVKISTLLRQKGHLVGRGAKAKRIGPYVVMVNDECLLMREWGYRLKSTDIVKIARLPGNGGGSNPLQIVAMLAVVVAATFVGGPAGVAALGKTGAAVAAAGVMIGGSLITQMMFPPKPLAQTPLAAREQVSPTYTFGANGNMSRLLEAIPVLYGRHIIWPDRASQPYVENRGNQQYLHQLFVVSQGHVEIETIRIEQTDVREFEEIQYEVVEPGGEVTLFPDNVITSPAVEGLAMLAPNEPGYSIRGPFVTNPAGTKINHIGIDLSYPGGVYRVKNNGGKESAAVLWDFEYQAIDDQGAPLGPWQPIISDSNVFATEQPQLISHKIPVAEGRYQIRGYRINNKSEDGMVRDDLVWASLRGYVGSTRRYGNVTMLALVTRGTADINGAIANKINIVATRKLRTWNPVEGWSENLVPTSSIAWAIADACRNSEYGRALPDTAYNLPELFRLDQVWSARGDEFNGVFDTTMSFWSALIDLCMVGRATPMYYAGVIDFIRNEPQSVPTAMFGPKNILAGTFQSRYLMVEDDSPDHIVMEYMDRDTWTLQTVECFLPGSARLNPFRLSMRGMTIRQQAWREGISRAAANRDQRRAISFTTGEEGLLPRYNDLCALSHDTPGWGYSGKVVELNRSTGIARLTEPVTFVAGIQHYVGFQKRNGKMDGPYRCSAASNGDPNLIRINESQAIIDAIYISSGAREEFTMYMFGPSERMYLPAVLHSAKPGKDRTVALTFVNYAESVYTAENGGNPLPPPPVTNLPQVPVFPIINEVRLELTLNIGEQVIVATPARGADYYEFQVRFESGNWATVGTDASPRFTVYLSAGQWSVRVHGVGRQPGPWTTWTGQVSASALPVPQLVSLTATQDEVFRINLAWEIQAETGGIEKSTEIWESTTSSLANAYRLIDMPFPARRYSREIDTPDTQRFYFARVIDRALRPGPWFNGGVGVMGKSSGNAEKIIGYFDGLIGAEQLTKDLLAPIEQVPGIIERVGELETGIEGTGTRLDQEIQDRVDGDKAVVRIVDTLAAQVQTNDETVKSMIQTETETRASAVEGLAQNISTMRVEFETSDAQVRGLIADETRIRTNQNETTTQRLDTAISEFEQNDTVVRGLIQTERETRASQNEAMSSRIDTVQSTADNAQASVQVVSQTVAGLDGKVEAAYTIKVQVASNNEQVLTGIGVGTSNTGGILTGRVIVLADQFVVGRNLNSGTFRTVFFTQGDVVYMHGAVIANATITMAKIGGDLYSSNWVHEQSGWILAASGTIQLNGNFGGAGRMTISNQMIRVFDGANRERVRLGIW